MQVEPHRKYKIELITRLIGLGLEPSCHAPSHGLVAETVFAAGACLIYAQLDVLVFDDLGRQQQVDLLSGEDRFRIALPERLDLSQALQQLWSDRMQWNLGVNRKYGNQILWLQMALR